MAINPSAPKLPEVDISLLQGGTPWVGPTGPSFTDPNFGTPNDQAQPEVDITLLPGVPAVSTTFIKETAVAATSYRHVQNAAATTWSINHNLKFRPNVTVFDSGSTMVEGNIVHVSINQLTIQFSAAISGTALLS